MSTNFPTSLDTLSNPASTDKLNAGSGHADQHADANDAIEALQAKVGINNSAVTTSLDYRVGALEDASVTLAAGAWTPTLTAGGDLDSVTLQGARYTRVGDVVLASVNFTAAFTAGTDGAVDITLPVATTLASTVLLGAGSASHPGATPTYGAVSVGEGSGVAQANWVLEDNGALTDSVSLWFSYIVV